MKGGGGGFFNNFTKSVQDVAKNTLSEATKVKEKFFEGQTQAEQISFTSLWEAPESVDYCRECRTKLQIMKHHCRSCAGIFCDDCCPSEVPNSFERAALIPATLPVQKGETIRLCLGCKRGECPGLGIKNKIRGQLDADHVDLTSGKVAKFQQKVAAKLEDAMNKITDIQVNESFYFYHLKRGSYYGENNMMKKSGSKPLAVSGYFEFYNKSSELVALKLIKSLDQNQMKFEAPRPSYVVVPPNEAVYTFFDGDNDKLQLILLWQNSSPIPTDTGVIYDTKAHGANPSRLSLCARIDLFERVQVFDMESVGRNALLKYKGFGIVHPREGTAMERVGFVNYFSGKRFADGKLDYQTNVPGVYPTYSLE